MIYYSVPFSIEKNIGEYYNKFMDIIPNDDDYGCFIDADTIFTTSDYGKLIEQVVEENPDVDCFTCCTNRVGCKWQICKDVDKGTNDIAYHRRYGAMRKEMFGTNVEDMTHEQLFSGVFFIIKKSSWNKIGGAKEEGMIGIDNDIHQKLIDNGMKLYLMKGLYLYHWYRWPYCNSNFNKHLL